MLNTKHLAEVNAEVIRAKRKFPAFPDDAIHMSAIINEEAGELTRDSLQFVYEDCRAEEIYTELIHTTAMCFRMFEKFIDIKKT